MNQSISQNGRPGVNSKNNLIFNLHFCNLFKTKKIPARLFTVFKLILFILFFLLLTKQFQKANLQENMIVLNNPVFLFLAVALIPVNWFFEWKKWCLITKDARHENRRNSFFAGIVSSMFTPALVGQLAGRYLFSESMDRAKVTVMTLQSNFSQFLVTLFFGFIAVIFLEQSILNDVSITAVGGLGLIFLVIYFLPSRFLQKVIGDTALHVAENPIRFRFLLFSLLRHLVFSCQFYCVLLAFEAYASRDLLLWIWIIYLLVTLVPSLFLGKLLIRESIAVFVLMNAGMGIQNWVVLISSLTIWTINLLIPSVIALFLLRSFQAHQK